MRKFEVITLDQEDWDQTVFNSIDYDFYHTQAYHKLETQGDSILLKTSVKENFIAIPLIKKSIPNTEYFDCTSAYGYVGPITNIDSVNNNEIVNFFNEDLKNFFNDQKIVACFSRLHPLLKNDVLIENLGTILPLNDIVSIDLNLTNEEQRKQYRKSNKYEINKLKKNNFYVEEATTREDIDMFIDIYTQTMNKVGASKQYYFTKDYFYRFLNNKSFTTKLLLAKHEDNITAGAIFTVTNNIMQYHLAGTDSNFAKLTPMKLIIDEARLIGNNLNVKYLNLGGGVSGSDQDSLFKFKSGFSNINYKFKVWRYVVNESIYNDLVKKSNADLNSNFFPLYRS